MKKSVGIGMYYIYWNGKKKVINYEKIYFSPNNYVASF